MVNSHCRAIVLASLLVTSQAAGALAGGSPMGVWIDHSGEGAVEILDCGGKLCGRVVWLKSAANMETCNLQVIGNAKPVAGGKWDGGWIYDPENKAQYDVELTPMGDKLKVLGYAGAKMFGETMMWKRAPGDLKRCDVRETKSEVAAVAPAAPLPPVVASVGEKPKADQPLETAAKPQAEPPVAVAPVPAPAAAPVTGTPAVQGQTAAAKPAVPAMKSPPKVAAKKFDLEEFIDKLDDIDVTRANGKCDVKIKELGAFKFDC